MYYPSRSMFRRLAKRYNLIPVWREIIADVETPVSAFQKLGGSEDVFLLESAESGGKLGRFSFLGSGAQLKISCQSGQVEIKRGESREIRKTSDPLSVVEDILSRYRYGQPEGLPPFSGGAVGYVSYDAVRHFEEISLSSPDDLSLPEAVFVFTDCVLIFDHFQHKIKVVANAFVEDNLGNLDEAYEEAVGKIEAQISRLRASFSPRPILKHLSSVYSETPSLSGVASNFSPSDFMKAVEKAKEYIRAGDILQVVLSQRFSAPTSGSSFDIYRALRTINPSPYMYYLKYGDLELIGSSPEPLVRVRGKEVITRPIAGTRPRGETEREDLQLQQELLKDEKERAEHIMLVDLGRNDLGRVCKMGTVEVDKLMFVEKYSHVMHTVSNVRGELKEGKSVFDVLRAAFPAGTVSGAPKIRAMEIIDELEPTLRGPYAGAVGYFSYSGNLDSCITIRTIVVKDGRAYVQAGAGIVADSVPEKEFQESVRKAQALLKAIQFTQEQ